MRNRELISCLLERYLGAKFLVMRVSVWKKITLGLLSVIFAVDAFSLLSCEIVFTERTSLFSREDRKREGCEPHSLQMCSFPSKVPSRLSNVNTSRRKDDETVNGYKCEVYRQAWSVEDRKLEVVTPAVSSGHWWFDNNGLSVFAFCVDAEQNICNKRKVDCLSLSLLLLQKDIEHGWLSVLLL